MCWWRYVSRLNVLTEYLVIGIGLCVISPTFLEGCSTDGLISRKCTCAALHYISLVDNGNVHRVLQGNMIETIQADSFLGLDRLRDLCVSAGVQSCVRTVS